MKMTRLADAGNVLVECQMAVERYAKAFHRRRRFDGDVSTVTDVTSSALCRPREVVKWIASDFRGLS